MVVIVVCSNYSKISLVMHINEVNFFYFFYLWCIFCVFSYLSCLFIQLYPSYKATSLIRTDFCWSKIVNNILLNCSPTRNATALIRPLKVWPCKRETTVDQNSYLIQLSLNFIGNGLLNYFKKKLTQVTLIKIYHVTCGHFHFY